MRVIDDVYDENDNPMEIRPTSMSAIQKLGVDLDQEMHRINITIARNNYDVQ